MRSTYPAVKYGPCPNCTRPNVLLVVRNGYIVCDDCAFIIDRDEYDALDLARYENRF